MDAIMEAMIGAALKHEDVRKTMVDEVCAVCAYVGVCDKGEGKMRDCVIDGGGFKKVDCNANGHMWEGVGGRGCPKCDDGDGDPNCSQSVYVCKACGEEDYGDEGGPAYKECFEKCDVR